MKRYGKYKPSKVDWIGDIPEHWSEMKLKWAVNINPSKSNCAYDPHSHDLVTFLPMERVYEDGKFDNSLKKPIKELWNGFTYFEEGDIILAKITPCFENGKGALLKDLGSPVGFGSTEFHVLRAKENINREFVYYITRTRLFRNMGEALMYGAAGQKRVPPSFLEGFVIVLPPAEEQATITNYLDRKTQQINELIAKKKKLIDLLNKEKTAIINQAVTKGLNPNAPMRDSGISWLGGIPAHWGVKKLKCVCSLLKDGTHLPPPRVTKGYPLLSVRNLVDGKRIQFLDDDSMISKTDFEGLERVFKVQENDVLLAIVGATMGKVALVPKMAPFTIQRSLAIFRTRESLMNHKYLFFFFQTSYFQSLLWNNTGFSAQPGIYLEALSNFSVTCPLMEEQKQIIDFVEIQTQKINTTISRIKREMELLQEYRTTSIHEAVTGKIDVRGAN